MPTSSCIHIEHPAVFPVELPEFFVKLMTEEGDVVLDPFMGSGTTALAARGAGEAVRGRGTVGGVFVAVRQTPCADAVVEQVIERHLAPTRLCGNSRKVSSRWIRSRRASARRRRMGNP